MSDFFNYFPLTSRESFITPDFHRRYTELVSGLDSASALAVARILGVLSHLCNLDANGLPHPPMSNFFTSDEISRILDNEKKLDTGILQLSSDAWAFGKYILPMASFEYSTFIDHCGLDTIDLSRLDSAGAILDVGGYIGDTALLLHNYFPGRRIFVFEPMAENFNLVLKTLLLNNIPNSVTPVNLALGDVPASRARATFMDSCSRVDDNPTGQEISVDTLDNWVAENNIDRVSLIKVDIEGGEQKFLHGAIETIKRDRPHMLLSIYHNPDDFFGIKPWVEKLNLGYKFRIFKPMNRNVITETLLLCIPE